MIIAVCMCVVSPSVSETTLGERVASVPQLVWRAGFTLISISHTCIYSMCVCIVVCADCVCVCIVVCADCVCVCVLVCVQTVCVCVCVCRLCVCVCVCADCVWVCVVCVPYVEFCV